MLDDQETLKRFGYLATSVKPKRRKRVVYRCSSCQSLGEIYREQYKGDNHLCVKCAALKRSMLEPLPNQLTNSLLSLSNLDDEATLKRFGYRASSLKPHSMKLIIYTCNLCYQQLEARRSDIQNSNHVCLRCHVSNQKVGKTVIAQDILKVTKELGHQPTVAEYQKFGKYDYTTVRNNFEKDWAEVLEEIGLVVQRKQYSVAEIEKEIKKVKAKLGKIPICSEYEKVSKISPHTVKKLLRCNSWLKVIMKVFKLDEEMAKTHIIYGKHQYRTTEQRLKELKELANKLGHSPSCREASDAGIEVTMLYKRLKTNWEGVLQAVGLDIKSLPIHSKVFFIKAEDIASDIREVVASLGKIPTQREYLANGSYGMANLYKYFPRWIEALKATGLDLKEKYRNKKDNTPRPTSHYLEEIQLLAQKLGHAPTTQEAVKSGIKIIKLYQRLKCSWAEILQQAGLKKEDLPSRSRFFFLTNKEVLEDVKRVAIELGRLPKKSDYREKGKYSFLSVIARFGRNWNNVLATIENETTEFLKLSSKQKEQSLVTKKLLNINPVLNSSNNTNISNHKEDSLDNITRFFQKKS